MPYLKDHLLCMKQQSGRSPTVPSSWGPSFSFSNSWAMCVFRSMMKDLGFCRRSTPSRSEAMRTYMGSSFSSWAPAHAVASSLSLFTLCNLPFPGSMIEHEKERPQLYKVCLTIYHNYVKLNSYNISYNMYIYIYTHIHIPSPGSGSLIES